jgi:hypothetical protein
VKGEFAMQEYSLLLWLWMKEPDIPKVGCGALFRQRKEVLVRLCEHLSIPADGTIPALRARLMAFQFTAAQRLEVEQSEKATRDACRRAADERGRLGRLQALLAGPRPLTYVQHMALCYYDSQQADDSTRIYSKRDHPAQPDPQAPFGRNPA